MNHHIDLILGDGEDPGPVLADMAADLESIGADFLVIPCNTAYVFEDAILAATHIPLISIIGVSITAAQERAPGAGRIGVLATDGCLTSGVFQAGLEAAGLAAELPTDDELRELMALVKTIKAGKQTDETARKMAGLAEAHGESLGNRALDFSIFGRALSAAACSAIHYPPATTASA